MNNKPVELRRVKEDIRIKKEIAFNEFRRLFLLYLEKLEKLTEEERKCFIAYFNCINTPIYVMQEVSVNK